MTQHETLVTDLADAKHAYADAVRDLKNAKIAYEDHRPTYINLRRRYLDVKKTLKATLDPQHMTEFVEVEKKFNDAQRRHLELENAWKAAQNARRKTGLEVEHARSALRDYLTNLDIVEDTEQV